MQTDGASEESSDSDNTDSEDEDGTFCADIHKYQCCQLQIIIFSHQRWIYPHQSA